MTLMTERVEILIQVPAFVDGSEPVGFSVAHRAEICQLDPNT